MSGKRGKPFMLQVISRYYADRYDRQSAYLTFLTLLNLVPILVLVLTFIAHMTVFQQMVGRFEQWIIDALIFQHKQQWVVVHIQRWVSQATQLSWGHLSAFVVMAVLMMLNINQLFQEIWHTEKKLSLTLHCLLMVLVLCLTPVVLVLLFGVSDMIMPLIARSHWLHEFFPGWFMTLLSSLSVMFVWFLLMYKILPLCRVPWRSAVLSSVVVSILLTVMKRGVMLWIDHYSSYHDLYGAMSVIPVCLVWLYLAWNVILFGSLMGHEFALRLARS